MTNKKVYKSGNELAAQAILDCNYDVFGYYPISPSTEIAQIIDLNNANGLSDIKLIPADGEHSSAGICYGASLTGARVVNATSANGLSFMLEQLPVVSGTRIPMVLNLVSRTVSGPLNIHCEHKDLYSTLELGWIVLCASTPQAVYDLNIIGLKLSETVNLPVIINYDGYITSHQKHNSFIFENNNIVQEFIGEKKHPKNKYIDNLENPLTIGAHMLPEHSFNNSCSIDIALNQALIEFEKIAQEYNKISNREYKPCEYYNIDNAETIIISLNSSAEICKDAIDKLNEKNEKVGLVKPILLRPFSDKYIYEGIKNAKKIIVLDRSDNPGHNYGVLAQHIQSVINKYKMDVEFKNIIYGLGGKEIYVEDIIDIVTTKYTSSDKEFYGITISNTNQEPIIKRHYDYISDDFKIGGFNYEFDETTQKLNVKIPPLRNLMKKPKRISSGHSACLGCGIFPGIETFLRGIEGDVIILNQTGCAYVVSANYPYSSHKGHYIHNLFQNGAATLSGLVEAIFTLKEKGKITFADDATFIMLSGDGGFDIGMSSIIGTALRNHKLILLEYDNEGYMNTGAQLSYATPKGHRTSTSNVGTKLKGKNFDHKDTVQIMAGCDIPYIFTGVDAFPQDLIKKAAKAQWYAQNVGCVYGKILITCPLNWKSREEEGTSILEKAVNCNFFPLYEIENSITNLTYIPEEVGNNIPVEEWLKTMYKSKHLLLPENKHLLEEFRNTVDKRFNRLKIKHEHPEL